MPGNDLKWLDWLELQWKCIEGAGYGWQLLGWQKMARHGWKWLLMAGNG